MEGGLLAVSMRDRNARHTSTMQIDPQAQSEPAAGRDAEALCVRVIEWLRETEGLHLCTEERGGLAYEPTAANPEMLARKFRAAQEGGGREG